MYQYLSNCIMIFPPSFTVEKTSALALFPRVFPTYLVAKKLSETKFLFLIFCYCRYNVLPPQGRWKKNHVGCEESQSLQTALPSLPALQIHSG